MYMEEPSIAALTKTSLGLNNSSVRNALTKYLGKLANSEAIGINITDANGDDPETIEGKYDLIGNGTSWYVVYRMDETDSGGVRKKLAAKADDVELYSTADNPNHATESTCGFTAGYSGTEITAKNYIALLVFGN